MFIAFLRIPHQLSELRNNIAAAANSTGTPYQSNGLRRDFALVIKVDCRKDFFFSLYVTGSCYMVCSPLHCYIYDTVINSIDQSSTRTRFAVRFPLPNCQRGANSYFDCEYSWTRLYSSIVDLQRIIHTQPP